MLWEKKLKNFGHHWEYQLSGLNLDDIKNMVKSKRAVYDYHADMRSSKWSSKEKEDFYRMIEEHSFII